MSVVGHIVHGIREHVARVQGHIEVGLFHSSFGQHLSGVREEGKVV